MVNLESNLSTRRALAECEVFSAFNEVDLNRVANLTEEREYATGKTIFEEKAPANEFLVLRQGRVALQRSVPSSHGPPTSMTVAILRDKQVITWYALIEPYVHSHSAVCLQPARVLAVDGIKLRSLVSANHHIGYNLLHQLLKVVGARLEATGRALTNERLMAFGNKKVGEAVGS